MKSLSRAVLLTALPAAIFITSVHGQERKDVPILIEQKIIAVELDPAHADGIEWDLLQLYLNKQKSTTGLFPLSERAHRRLDFKPMKKRVPPGREANTDFENVEQTRMSEFNFGPSWEDVRLPTALDEDVAFGSLRIYRFQPVMDYLRSLGRAKVLFSRKWVTSDGEQSVVSSQPELAAQAQVRGPAPAAPQEWEGSRLTIRPEIIENNRIAFHLVSEVAATFYAAPELFPGNPVTEIEGIRQAKIWRLFRLNTKGIVESGQTAVFEDFREGQGIIILTTPSILEVHRKILRD